MRNERDFRQKRRREFDDDGYQPPRDFGFAPRPGPPRFEQPTGPTVRGTVKWFNPEKGFGFVQLEDGSGDAFLHSTVLGRTGITAVSPGATLEMRVAMGQKGPQVSEVLNVDESTAQQEPARRPPRVDQSSYPTADQPAVEEIGTVKFYDAGRGFGFIARDRGGKDVFVHATALNRAGITGLAEGQRVSVDVVEGRKGPEAVSVRVV